MKLEGRTGEKVALKERQEDISAQEVYLESVMSSMTDSLIVVNPDATLRSVNRAALDLLGYREEELIGQPVKNIFLQEEEKEEGKEEESMLHRYFQEIITAGVAYNIGLTFLTKQDKAIPVNFSGAAMQQNGQIIGIVGVARDMRQIMAIIGDLEEKKIELEERSKNLTRMQRAMLHMMGDLDIAKKEAERAEKELKKLDQLKKDFISTVSHELRTPLAITKEGIRLILDGITGEMNDKQEKILSIAGSNIDRLARIIDGLLDLSKIESGKVELKRGLVDIAGMIRQVASSFELNLKGKPLELRINVPKKQIDAFVDPDKLIQVFTNLIGNAFKFTDSGYIEVSLQEREKEIECVVVDTGLGITEEDMPKVFSKFEQFGRLPGPGEKGTGLGLAITKGIIELHGGKIWVESEPGQGAKFSFVLPKYTTEGIFKEYLNNEMREAMGKKTCMTLVAISILEFSKLKQEFSDEKMDAILRSMEGVVKGTVRREGEVAFGDSGEMMVILADCDKEGALSVENRLREALDKYLTNERLPHEIRLRFGSAVYPDEAKDDEELIKEAKEA
ncbi:MAG: ATP-binding protein [Candidatus Eisenbacteria bacterium]|nr:ATP-binding protein [Candidatus Eisenbacteria bacterium]